jgi:hypothetical protein
MGHTLAEKILGARSGGAPVNAGDVVVASVTGIRFGTTLLWAVVCTAALKFVLTEALARWQLAPQAAPRLPPAPEAAPVSAAAGRPRRPGRPAPGSTTGPPRISGGR